MAQSSSRASIGGVAHQLRYLLALCLTLLALGGIGVSQTGAAKLAQSLTGAPKKDSTPPLAPASPPAAATPAPSTQAIDLPDVAARSEDLNRLLRDVADQLPTPEQLEASKTVLDERETELQSKLTEVDALLAGAPSSLEVREEENYWRSMEKDTAASRQQLLDWANAAQSAIQKLQAQQPQWTATLEENESTSGLGPTLDVIQQSVQSIQQLQTQVGNQLRLIVNLQVRAASQDQLALDVLDRLTKARGRLEGRLLERDSLPLWQLTQRRQIGENNEFFLTPSARLRSIQAFARDSLGALAALALFGLLSLFAAYRLHLATRHVRPVDRHQAQVLHIVRHWIGLGLLPPLLCGYLLAPLAPLALISLGILISWVPILILLPPSMEPRYRTLLYCLFGVYAINAFVGWMSLSAAHKREVQFLANLAIFLAFIVLVRPARMKLLEGATRSQHIFLFGMRLAVGLLGVSLTANLFGYVKLAQSVGYLSLYSTFIAISVLAGVRVFTFLLLAGVEVPAAQQLAAIRLHRDGIVRWVPRILRWSGIFIWLIATLDLMGVRDQVTDGISDILNFHIAGRSASITLGGVVGCFLILLIGYAISSALRFLVREELLSRFHLSRGLPELIASTLHYLLLLLVFFFAVNLGGVELNKFTVLTGALGVGVGFGLQNIVNNFVSGLILQFERPIHIGDVLDIDGTTGKVSRIGIRSSTVKTFQGAEVIIPNANFISGKVINWTLSESLRRVELPVGVAYGSDVKLVSKLLEQPATAHESVLTSPAPAVYFKEFGDSSLNFELQFWVMQESNTVKVKSEVALEVMRLLDEAGVEIPFPQRDLRLRSVDASAAATLLSSNGSESHVSGDREPNHEASMARNPGKSRSDS
ncbi:MAG: mechanosensitive ion channel domain-containing protein [Candidatus Korobacteraceae bacterium]